MKRLALAAIAAATFAAPLAIPTTAAAEDHRGRHERGWDRHDRDYDDRDDRRDERRAYRDGRRDERRADRWDDRRYNGYYREGRWFYGPPPSHYRDVRYDYRHWRRGERLPRYYRDRYHSVDYRDYRLRAPPRGYHYVRDDRGDIILAAIATGIIASVILANN
jgi:Ni/Co efflux regulator RcnB